MKKVRFTQAAAAALVAAACLSPAAAADIPDLVGTWKAVDGESVIVRFGAASEHNPAEAAPSIVAPAGQAWTIVVETQEGRAFHGHALSPKGEKETFVGVVHRDGEHLVMADAEGELSGEIDDGRLDVCWTDDKPGRAVVACSLFAKQ